MKRFIHLLLFLGLILPPALCGASYLIEFKSGSKFVTSHYWTTGSQVNFYSRGGVMGVPKTMIKQIVNTNQNPDAEFQTQPEDQAKEKILKTPENNVEAQSQKQAKDKTSEPKMGKDIDVEALKMKKAELEDKVKLAKENYNKVVLSDDNVSSEAAMQEYLKHRKELIQFRKYIKKQNNNELPKWW